jgi:glycerol-3-phosphate dehydrogenase
VLVSASGLVTITGGKWTTYRRMGQDTIDRAAEVASLDKRPSRTVDLKLHGWTDAPSNSVAEWEQVYGSDRPQLHALSAGQPDLEELLHPMLPYKRREVVWAARYEMARTVEDVLARRTHALFLNARAAMQAAPAVAKLLGSELQRSDAWVAQDLERFLNLARGYLYAEV